MKNIEDANRLMKELGKWDFHKVLHKFADFLEVELIDPPLKVYRNSTNIKTNKNDIVYDKIVSDFFIYDDEDIYDGGILTTSIYYYRDLPGWGFEYYYTRDSFFARHTFENKKWTYAASTCDKFDFFSKEEMNLAYWHWKLNNER